MNLVIIKTDHTISVLLLKMTIDCITKSLQTGKTYYSTGCVKSKRWILVLEKDGTNILENSFITAEKRNLKYILT